jgi:hypothetical protein
MTISIFDVNKSTVDIAPFISKGKGEIDANFQVQKVKSPSFNAYADIERKKAKLAQVLQV